MARKIEPKNEGLSTCLFCGVAVVGRQDYCDATCRAEHEEDVIESYGEYPAESRYAHVSYDDSPEFDVAGGL
jgi:hypothetical protein